MSHLENNIVVDLGWDGQKDQQPVPRLVNLILQQAILDSADRIEFSLSGSSPKETFRISYSSKTKTYDLAPPPSTLFEPAIVTLCNYASVPYCAKGPVKGRVETRSPDSSWLLESEELKRSVILSRIKEADPPTR